VFWIGNFKKLIQFVGFNIHTQYIFQISEFIFGRMACICYLVS